MSFLSGIGDQLKNAGGALIGKDYLRDYRHAAKTFRTKSYAYAPKYKFLFHVYFNINKDAWAEGAGKNYGLLVKDIKLPSFSFNTVQMNQYNRKRIVQTKIKYDPINITFHDDNSNVINKMWYAYYTYYYNDGNKPNLIYRGKRGSPPVSNGINNEVQPSASEYNNRDTYAPTQTDSGNWGYYAEATNGNSKIPFFQNITVFGFNQHNYTAYTLVNPVITLFGHDTYNYEEGGGAMKNNMTIDYETVAYDEGAIDGRKPEEIATGFGDNANYDRKTSPWMLPGANGTILGPGGLVDGAGGIVNSFSNQMNSGFSLAGIANMAVAGARLYNTAKNMDLASTAEYELMNMLAQSAWEYGSPIARNRNIQFDIPNKSVTPYTIGTAGAPTIAPAATNQVMNLPNIEPITTAGSQVTSTQNINVSGGMVLPTGR